MVLMTGVEVVSAKDGDDGPSPNITITANKLKFKPDTVTVSAGEKVTIKMDNKGYVSHSFDILKPDAPLTASDSDAYLHRTHSVQSDSYIVTTFSIDEPGQYKFVCDVATHVKAGMKGTLIVTADSDSASDS